MNINIIIIAAITASSIIVFPLNCLAGRPVFHEFSFGELTQQADVVAIVTKAKPFNISDRSSGCEKLSWRFKVKTVLKQGQQPIKGKILQIQHNSTAFRDCTFRLSNPSGASFGVYRYQPSQPIQSIINSPESIIFLTEYNGKLELVADQALEAIGKRQELQTNK
jgi:hypothetical protein